MGILNIDGYNSYSGCDIVVTASLPLINGQAIGKYYTLGSIQTLSISTHQDKRPVRSLGIINAKDYVMGPRTIAGSMVFAVFNKHFATDIMNDLGATQADVILPDEIPALDITVSFANEYGKRSRMAIYGVKLLNEGQVMSINDLYTENTYQFVALGLEPLSAEDNGGQIPQRYSTQSTPDMIVPEDHTYNNNNDSGTNFENNSGSNISDEIKNNQRLESGDLIDDSMTIDGNDNILLNVSVQDATSNKDLGLAYFSLSPDMNTGQIDVNIGNAKKDESDYIIAVTDANNVYSVSLPVGNYTAQYMDNQSNRYSNVITFSIIADTASTFATIESIQVIPVIEKVTDDSISVANNYTMFDTINYFKKGDTIQSMPLSKKSMVLSNLEPDTEYYIYYSKIEGESIKKSNVITVKTFEEDMTEGEYLKDYLITNKDLLVNPLDDMIGTVEMLEGKVQEASIDSEQRFIAFAEATIANQEGREINSFRLCKTPIDAVLTLPDSSIKQELLVFANKLTTQLISSYNKDYKQKQSLGFSQEHPFSSKIDIGNYDNAYIFEYKDNKTYLINTFSCALNSFYGKPNKHYCVYGFNEDNESQSIKRDFSICRNSYIETLSPYTKTRQYTKLNPNHNKLKYTDLDYNTLLELEIRENCFCDLNVLPPPNVYISENEQVYADVKYNFLNTNNSYYLVCAEIYESLDHTPFRKIEFDAYTHDLNLNKYYLGLAEDSKYLFWIETKDGLKISKPYLFEYTLNENTDIKELYKQDLSQRIEKIRKEMAVLYPNVYILNELFDYVYDCNPHEKDLYDLLEYEMINYCKSSKYEETTFEMLFDLKNIIHNKNQMKILPDVVIDKDHRCIQFENIENYYMCGVQYTDSGIDRIYEADNIMSYGDSGYIVVYLTNKSMIYKSGFVLIDCVNNRYTASSDLLDYITEGVII